jgi:hypothetical protein
MPQRGNPKVFVQARVTPEYKRIFEAHCAVFNHSQSEALDLIFRSIAFRWKERLSAENWQRFLKREIPSAEALEAYRQNPLPPSAAGSAA